MTAFCRRGHPIDETTTYTTPDGRRCCRPCNRAAAARYRRTNRGRVAVAGWRVREQTSGAVHAKNAVARAIRGGRLVRLPCEYCGSLPSEAHHYNGYAREHRLDVIWLCKRHHVAAHLELRAAA